jgi:hypothetical protein
MDDHMIRTLRRTEIDGEVCFVLSDEDAIDLAHGLADGMNIASVEAYNAIISGDAAFKGIRLVVTD